MTKKLLYSEDWVWDLGTDADVSCMRGLDFARIEALPPGLNRRLTRK